MPSLRSKTRKLSYGEQLAVIEEVIERFEKSFDEFKKEFGEELKSIHLNFVRKSDFDHKFDDMGKSIEDLNEKVDEGFKGIEERLKEGKKVTDWLKKNLFFFLGVTGAILYLIDRIPLLKDLLKL